MKATESTAAAARADGYFAADWAQPRPRRRAARRISAEAAEQKRLSREFQRARALAAASPRLESRGRRQGADGGMVRILRGMKLNFYAFPRDLVLNEKIAERILEASGFLSYETVPSV